MYTDKMVIEDLNFYPVDESIKNVIINKIDEYDENGRTNIMLIILGTAVFLAIMDITLKHSEAAIWIIGCILLCIIAMRAFFYNNKSNHAKIKYIKESLNSSQFQITSALIDKVNLIKYEDIDISNEHVVGYNYEIYAKIKSLDGRSVDGTVACVICGIKSDDEADYTEFKEGKKIYIIRYMHNDEYNYYGISENTSLYFEDNLKYILECSYHENLDIKV